MELGEHAFTLAKRALSARFAPQNSGREFTDCSARRNVFVPLADADHLAINSIVARGHIIRSFSKREALPGERVRFNKATLA